MSSKYSVSEIFHEKCKDLYDHVVVVSLKNGSNIEGVFADEFYEFAYTIKGSIEKVVINNGRKLESKSVSVVKIPNAIVYNILCKRKFKVSIPF